MREKIAIIGSGISGISAAYLLSSKYDIYLFEKNNRLGGHTRTIYVEESTKTIPVDTGFIVFNENNYPDLTNFFKLLDVKCKNSDMSFAVSNQDPQIEYSGKNIFSLFANFRNVFSFNSAGFFICVKECKSAINKNDSFSDLFAISIAGRMAPRMLPI